jgi:hypothetical protein
MGKEATGQLTDDAIITFRHEAEAEGNTGLVHVCNVALEREDPVTTEAQYEERYGGGGLLWEEKAEVMAAPSAEAARERIASILDGRG